MSEARNSVVIKQTPRKEVKIIDKKLHVTPTKNIVHVITVGTQGTPGTPGKDGEVDIENLNLNGGYF